MQDEFAHTASLDFSFVVSHPTNPDLVYVYQGAGEIPYTAFTITAKSAHLSLPTPDSYVVMLCNFNIITGEYSCAPTGPITFDLIWSSDGIGSVNEKTKRVETLGPVSTKYQAELISHTATVSGSWAGLTATNLTGNLYDTQGKTFIREVTLAASP